MSKNKSPRILITRLSHIGDCILTLPMLCALRKKIPNAFIAWAAEAPSQQLLNLHPDIDEIIPVPKGWLSKPKSWPELFGRLRQPRFDIAIDPQGITKSASLARISRAKTRIGIRGRWGRELSPYLNNCLVETTSTHLVDRSIELLSVLGVKNFKIEYRLPVCSESQKSIQQFLHRQRHGGPFVVINPGASWESKRWVTGRFATVASHLYKRYGLKAIVTWAGNDERAMADRIISLNPPALVMADQTSLTELAALCQQAKFFIGCDTGPLHIAAAMGTPCIGLYGTTRSMDSGAYGPANIAVQKWHQSGSCRKRRNASNDAMRDIMASDVNEACDRMIAKLGSGRHLAA
jgi:heptosyltransferase-1